MSFYNQQALKVLQKRLRVDNSQLEYQITTLSKEISEVRLNFNPINRDHQKNSQQNMTVINNYERQLLLQKDKVRKLERQLLKEQQFGNGIKENLNSLIQEIRLLDIKDKSQNLEELLQRYKYESNVPENRTDDVGEIKNMKDKKWQKKSQTIEKPKEVFIQKIIEGPKEIIIERIIEVPRQIIVERIIEVPKQVFKEVIVEKIVQVPKEIIVERLIEVPKEIIIEVMKQMVVEKVIEVPKQIVVEKIIEILKEITVEKIVEVQKEIIVERIIEVPKQIIVERIIEVPKQITVEVIKQVIVEKLVEVSKQIVVQKIVEVIKEVVVQKIVQVPKQIIVQIEKEAIVEKIIEIPIELVVQRIVQVIVEKIVQIPKEVAIQKIVEVIKEVVVQKIVQVPKQIIVEVIKEVVVQKIVQVPKQIIVEVIKEVIVERIIENQNVLEIPMEIIIQNIVQVPKIVSDESHSSQNKFLSFQLSVDESIAKYSHPQQIPVENIVRISTQAVGDHSMNIPLQNFHKQPSTSLELPVQNISPYSNLISMLSDRSMRSDDGYKRMFGDQDHYDDENHIHQNFPTEIKQKQNLGDHQHLAQIFEMVNNLRQQNHQLNGKIQNMVEYIHDLTTQLAHYEKQEEEAEIGEENKEQNQNQNSFQNQLVIQLKRQNERITEDAQNQREFLKKQINMLSLNSEKLIKQKSELKKVIDENLNAQKQNRRQTLENIQFYKQQNLNLHLLLDTLKDQIKQKASAFESLQQKIENLNEQKNVNHRKIQEKQIRYEALIQEMNYLRDFHQSNKNIQINNTTQNKYQIAIIQLNKIIDNIQSQNSVLREKFIEMSKNLQQSLNELEKLKNTPKPKDFPKFEHLHPLHSSDKQKLVKGNNLNQKSALQRRQRSSTGYQEIQQRKMVSSKSEMSFSVHHLKTPNAQNLPKSQGSQYDKDSRKNDGSRNSERETMNILRKVIKKNVTIKDNSLTNNQLLALIEKIYTESEYKQLTNSQLKNMVVDLQSKLSVFTNQNQEELNQQYSESYFKRLQKGPKNSERKLVDSQRKNNQFSTENGHLQTSNSQRHSFSSNVDNETKMLIEQLTSQMHSERSMNLQLQKKLQRQHKELISSERQIFEKTQKINYLNLMLIKKQDPSASRSLQVSNGSDYNQSNLQKIIFELKSKLRKSELEMLELKKSNRNLQNDVKILKTTYSDEYSGLKIKPHWQLKPEHQHPHFKNTQIGSEQPASYTLSQFIQKFELTNSDLRAIILKVTDQFLSSIANERYYCFEPNNIILIGNPDKVITLQVRLSQQLNTQHIFSSPQILKHKKGVSELAMVWNLGILIDYILSKQPYFQSIEEIKKFNGYYMPKRQLQFKGLKQILSSMINPFQTLRSSLDNCRARFLQTLYK